MDQNNRHPEHSLTERFGGQGIAMFCGVAIMCIVNYYVNGRKSFRGPVVNVRED